MAKAKTKYETKKRIVKGVCHTIDEGKRCNLVHYARGVCNLHYRRFMKDPKLAKKFMNKAGW